MRSAILLACLLAVCYQAYGLKQAVARINARGITGTITFTAVNATVTRIVTNLQGLTGNQGWHVHQLPIDQTISPDDQCLSQWAGPHYDPFNARPNPDYTQNCAADPSNCEAGDLAGRLGLLPPNGQLDKVDSTGDIVLEGLNSIVGRSVVIHEMGTNANFECGTILSQEELNGAAVTILQSVFVSPVAGRMYFKQVAGLNDVQIWGKLYHVNDSATSMAHNWHIHRDRPGETYRVGVCGPEAAGPHYDPTNQVAGSPGYSTRCTPPTPTGCEVGDLTGKLGTVDVAARPAPYNSEAFFFTDSFLNLTGFQAVVDRSVVVHVANRGAPRLSCAPLVQAENITLTAYPIGGQSLAIISQYSRFQDTRISLGALPSLGIPPSLGTDNADLTIVTAALGPNGACLQDGQATPTSDSTYSPYKVRSGVTTPDGYALGDLSGAYKSDVTSNNLFSVFDLPVFGANTTVSGHVLRYIYGNRRMCVPLLPPTSGVNITALRASFSGRDIEGNVFFVQARSDDVETGSTLIVVDVYYKDGSRQRTSGHNWHIHSNPTVAGQTCSPTIGGHYNPFSVSLATGMDAMNSDYKEDCTSNYQLRCESGDMSGKHGQLDLAAFSAGDRPTYTYVDNNLELGGAYQIAGRSVGLHLPSAQGGNLFDCATITPFFKSVNTISIYTPEGEYSTRAELVRMVSGDDIPANDILVVSQTVTNGCVVTVVRTIGGTQGIANGYANILTNIASSQFTQCDPNVVDDPTVADSGAHLPLLSPLFLLLPLLFSSLL